MANTFISVKEIARETLPRLLENLVFPSLIYKDYSNDYQPEKGATIQVKKPVKLKASKFDPANGTTAQDVKRGSVDVTLDTIATVDIEIGALEHAVSVGNLNEIFIEPAAVALAEQINSDGLDLYADIPNFCGTAGTTPDGLDDFANAAKVLNKLNAPILPRHGVWDPDADAKFKQLPALVNANKAGTTAALRTGAIGNVFNIDNYMAQGIKSHTTGATGTPLVDKSAGFAAGATQIHVDGLTTAFKVGDLFTIADDSTQYVVTVQYLYIALMILLGAFSLYLKANVKLRDRIAQYIAKAEAEYKDSVKAGGKKFEWVVTQLYTLVPAAFKPFITRTVIGIAVQKVFDWMQAYAKLQLDNVLNGAEK